jgi:large subunit ribosomal protein L1
MKKENLKEKFDLSSVKTLSQAIDLLPQLSTSKFVGTGNLDIVLNLKEKQLKESVRGNVNLPHKISGDKKIVVICDDKDSKKAIEAGAIEAGLETVVEKLMNNEIDFDIVIATPAVMPKIIKLGKVLGPRGLMPNPKNGTISDDVASAVKGFMSGRTSFKMEQGQGVIRTKVVKLDMTKEAMEENILEMLRGIFGEVRRFGANPFKKITLKPTMGGVIKLDINDIIAKIK